MEIIYNDFQLTLATPALIALFGLIKWIIASTYNKRKKKNAPKKPPENDK